MATLIRIIARIIIILLWARFVLALFAVAARGIIATIYEWSGYFVAPFRGIFPDQHFLGLTIESNTLLAIVVYAFIEFILIKVVTHSRDDIY